MPVDTASCVSGSISTELGSECGACEFRAGTTLIPTSCDSCESAEVRVLLQRGKHFSQQAVDGYRGTDGLRNRVSPPGNPLLSPAQSPPPTWDLGQDMWGASCSRISGTSMRGAGWVLRDSGGLRGQTNQPCGSQCQRRIPTRASSEPGSVQAQDLSLGIRRPQGAWAEDRAHWLPRWSSVSRAPTTWGSTQ